MFISPAIRTVASPGSWLCCRQPIIRHLLISRSCGQSRLVLYVRRPKVDGKEDFHIVPTLGSPSHLLELSNHQGVTGNGGIASVAEPSPSMPTAERSQERIIAKGKWSCAHFPKRSRQLVVASRDPPLLFALPHRHLSATSCWLGACGRPTIRKRELAVRRLKFPCPLRNLRWCNAFEIIS